MSKKINISKEVLIDFINKGYTDTAIAKELGCSISVVGNRRKDYGIPKPSQKGVERPKTYKSLELSTEEYQVLLGTAIADGTLEISKFKNGNARLKLVHCKKQEDYLRWKVNKLHKIFKTKISDSFSTCKNNKFPTVRINSITHADITSLYHKLYTKGIKGISKEIIDTLTPLGLAVIFMDDGGYNGNKMGILCLCSFTREECFNFISMLYDKYGIFATIKGKPNRWYIQFGVKAFKKFSNLIKPYVIESMKYKFGQGAS